MPVAAVDSLLGVAGPDVEVPLAVVELRLMGGALARPAAVPNAVAGREGCFSLLVVAPAPPPLAATATAVTDGVLHASGAVVARHEPGQLRRTRQCAGAGPRLGAGRPGAAAPGQGGPSTPTTSSVARSGADVRPGRCAMTRPVVVAEPGRGHRVGNVEFLARTVDTPFFNLGFVVLEPGQGRRRPRARRTRTTRSSWSRGRCPSSSATTPGKFRRRPGTFVLVPAGTPHEIANHGTDAVRILNIHAPGGFDRRIGLR